MKAYKTFKKELLKDKEVKKEYEELRDDYKLIEFIIEKRLERGFTQAELAKKIGTKQSAISRLEGGSYNPSLDFLHKVASALNTELHIVCR